MQNDEGNRPDRPASQPDAEQPQEPVERPEPSGGEWPDADRDAAVPPDETRPWSTDAPAAGTAAPESWPTEPPSADASDDAGAWPTTSPERSDAGAAPAGQEEMEASTAPTPEPAASDDAAVTPPATEPEPQPEFQPQTQPAPVPAPEEWPQREGTLHEPPPSEVEAYPGAAAIAPAAGAAAAGAAHSVPDSGAALGESTLCPRCGTENRPGLAFCRNCGQRLMAAGVAATVERPSAPEGTQACPRCGTHNRSGVAFCQNCGANLRAVEAGYVPPAVAPAGTAAAAAQARGGAVLGPVVLIIGLIGIVTAYLLPFAYGTTSLYDRAAGSGGYGVAFWNGYADVSAGLADQAYFGLAAPAPAVGVLLLLLAIAGFVRAAPGGLQRIGLLITLLWSIGVIVLFTIVEVLGNWDGDVVGLLRVLSPAGIILVLASLIVLIGTLTRLARS